MDDRCDNVLKNNASHADFEFLDGLRPGSNRCFSENTIFYFNCRSSYLNKIKLSSVL